MNRNGKKQQARAGARLNRRMKLKRKTLFNTGDCTVKSAVVDLLADRRTQGRLHKFLFFFFFSTLARFKEPGISSVAICLKCPPPPPHPPPPLEVQTRGASKAPPLESTPPENPSVITRFP